MTIGIGMNVSNSLPSTCLNDQFGEKLSPEEILNAYMTEFARLTAEFDVNSIIEQYIARWYHHMTWVTV
jgi:biotin-(acetyl-CoA carboxylase) ligase